MRLNDSIAIVTGAGSGIGAACVERFLSEGAKVAGIDRKVSTQAPNGACRMFSGDVACEASMREIAEQVQGMFGPADIIVNCAALTVSGDTISTTAASFRNVFDVNVVGCVNVCHSFVPLMQKRRGGSIVNVASVNGIVGAPGLSAYAASKGALITLTRTMALELAACGIRVNCVCPASVDTPMLQDAFDRAPDPASARELNRRRHPLGRLGRPQDIANLILFLASDEASWITGGTYLIDGGASIARRWQE